MGNAVKIINNRLNVLFQSKDRYESLSAADTDKEMKKAYERLIDDCNNGIGELSLVLFEIQNQMTKGEKQS